MSRAPFLRFTPLVIVILVILMVTVGALCLTVAVVLATGRGAAGEGPDEGRVIEVPEGGDLQAAIDGATPGVTIALAPGATYVGNFRLPAKPQGAGAARPLTIRTGGDGAGLPSAGERIEPGHARRLAKLRSPNRQPVLRTEPGASHWRLELLEFPPTTDGFGDIMTLGSGAAAQNELATIPHNLAIDRIYMYGDPEKGQKRGIALNSGATTITNSHISGIKAVGQDSQAIAGWNGPGPYRIENNYLEAAGENFLLGGADPAVRGLVTQDVVFRRNHLAKPLEWRDQRWVVKNLFQLKNARKVLVEENLMEYTWRHGQVGYAIVLSPRNQDGRADWTTVEDVTIRRNLVRHAGGGLQIIGEDSNHPSGPTRGIRITGNIFYDLDARRWGGTGAFALVGDGPSDVTIEHNTVSQSGNIVMAYGGRKDAPTAAEGFVFRGNVIRHNNYGVHGADRAPGRDSLDAFFPGAVFAGNVIAGGSAGRYPDGNRFIDAGAFDRLFVAAAEGDFRPAPGGLLARPGAPRVGADV
ncbi:MAG TPA: hypothetical protein VMN03_00050, partial [Burkholderiales bacterium]|nr:hypothetical protein [Burkholderiales bacterium]